MERSKFFFTLKLAPSESKRCVSFFLSSFFCRRRCCHHFCRKFSYLFRFNTHSSERIISLSHSPFGIINFLFFFFCHSSGKLSKNSKVSLFPPHKAMFSLTPNDERANKQYFCHLFSFLLHWKWSNKRNQKCKFLRVHAHTCILHAYTHTPIVNNGLNKDDKYSAFFLVRTTHTYHAKNSKEQYLNNEIKSTAHIFFRVVKFIAKSTCDPCFYCLCDNNVVTSVPPSNAHTRSTKKEELTTVCINIKMWKLNACV